jgi:hypothetical protein
MIWFACKQCGKRLQRPETVAGSLVFCTCGETNRVPWESSIPEPEAAPAPPARATEGPALPMEEELEEVRRPNRRRRTVQKRDPARCFNHESVPSRAKCADCGEAFCEGCVVTVQDRALCGPCKNFHVRTLQRPAEVSAQAIIAFVIALVSGPPAFCLTWLPQTPEFHQGISPVSVACGALALIGPFVALGLGAWALRNIEGKPNAGGQSLAVMSICTAGISLLWCVTNFLLVIIRPIMD